MEIGIVTNVLTKRPMRNIVLSVEKLMEKILSYAILVQELIIPHVLLQLCQRFHEGNGNVQDATKKVPRVEKIPSLVKKVLQHIYCNKRMTKRKLIQTVPLNPNNPIQALKRRMRILSIILP